MKLNHLNLTVTDVQESHLFLEKYFGMTNGSGNNNIAFLSDENGIVLTPCGPALAPAVAQDAAVAPGVSRAS
jgi:catechol 2,3-dioxygenase-like lactoylglutathione lyase family enzyme